MRTRLMIHLIVFIVLSIAILLQNLGGWATFTANKQLFIIILIGLWILNLLIFYIFSIRYMLQDKK